jgi:anti-sigma B factor antagonist
MMALEINSATTDGGIEITVAGTVDLYSAPQLRSALLESVPAEQQRIVVNLDGVTYMDSSGVAVLVEGLRSARTNDTAFVLSHPSSSVMKVLELAKLDQIFEIEGQ